MKYLIGSRISQLHLYIITKIHPRLKQFRISPCKWNALNFLKVHQPHQVYCKRELLGKTTYNRSIFFRTTDLKMVTNINFIDKKTTNDMLMVF